MAIASLPVNHLRSVPERVDPGLSVRAFIGDNAVDAGIHWSALVVDVVSLEDRAQEIRYGYGISMRTHGRRGPWLGRVHDLLPRQARLVGLGIIELKIKRFHVG